MGAVQIMATHSPQDLFGVAGILLGAAAMKFVLLCFDETIFPPKPLDDYPA